MESDASPSRCFGQSFVVSTMSVRGDFSAVPGRRLRGQEPFAERRGGGGAPPAGGACFSGNAHPRTPSEDGLGSDLKQAATKGGPGAKRLALLAGCDAAGAEEPRNRRFLIVVPEAPVETQPVSSAAVRCASPPPRQSPSPNFESKAIAGYGWSAHR
jgi:hypothetical protein